MVEISGGAASDLFLLLLLCLVLFAGLAKLLRVPYPILLVLAGIALSFVPHMPRITMAPRLVFVVFLPPLLYSAAWTLSWREFRRNVTGVAMLAFGLVLTTILILSVGASTFLPGFDWKSGLLLGAVVAATDAIAATSVARRVGLPHSVVALLEAESLVNDGTGLLALQFGLAILLRGQVPSFVEGVGRLVFLTGGGVLLGLVLGFVIAQLEEFLDDGPIEIVISVLVPYATYVIGERIHVSGVLAVIACGMYMSRQSPNFLSAQVRLQSTAVWEALTFALNGIVFLLLGLQVPLVLAGIEGIGLPQLALYATGFSTAMILLRFLWVFAESQMSRVVTRWFLHEEGGSVLSRRELLVVGWGGMRGVLCLAAAVSLPTSTSSGPFRQRSFIIFLAFSLIVATLVVQGLTLPWLIQKLGLSGRSDLRVEEHGARRTMLREVLVHLGRRRSKDHYEQELLEDLTSTYQQRLDALPPDRRLTHSGTQPGRRRLDAMLDALQVERATLLRLRDEGRIDDEVLRSLQKELDLSESRISSAIA